MTRVPAARVKFKGDGMYRSVDAALSAAYKIWGVRIEPQNNTAQVINWKES